MPLERRLADLLASVVKKDNVPADANFFKDLGADSLVMAQFCARVRKQPGLPTISIKDVYQHPTITALAGALAPAEPVSVQVRLAEVLSGVLGGGPVPVDANFFDDLGADSLVMAQFCARVRKQPGLPTISIKDVYQHPTITTLAGALAPPEPVSVQASVQVRLAEVLSGVLGGGPVPVDANFFDDLGADSLVMAQFCARVRKQPDLPAVSIKDVYQHPTITTLAGALAPPEPAPSRAVAADTHTAPAAGPGTPSALAPTASSTRGARGGRHRLPPAGGSAATPVEYVVCGALQVLIFLAYTYLFAVIFERGLQWIWAGGNLLDDYVRSVGFGAVTFVAMCTFPILVKWVLIGRWRPQEIRIWSLGYVRFWFVKTVVSANPLVLFAGSPLYLLYLRALGAKVGRGAVVFTRSMPVCTDMLTIGEHTVIDKDTFLSGYRAINGVIQTGPVSIGKNVFIGEKAVLDIGTSLGDGAQLGHASALHAGQAVPAGEHWHGSPGQRTESDYRAVASADCGTWRRTRYGVLQLALLLGVTLPVAVGGMAMLLVEVPWLADLLTSPEPSFTSAPFYGFVLVTSVLLFFGGILLGLLLVMTVPRLLNLAITPDRVYPLYGFRFACHRTIEGMTNRRLFHDIFGDSSYIVHYLQRLGYKLAPVVQTGSNFGTEIKHDNPYLNSVGTGTVVASGISIVNANYSSTSFSVSRTSIAANSFFGNEILYPPQAKTGEGCLIATKALVPIDGPVREGVGLLGSPAFEIPRTVQRDSEFILMAHDEALPRRLAAKNKHNLVTIGLFLLTRWFQAFVTTLLAFLAVDLYATFGEASLMLLTVPSLLFRVFYGALIERASTGFKPLKPKHCSIYDIDFWRTERFYKLEAEVSPLFNGTPFKGAILRLLGVRVGKRLFDDGAQIAEKNLVTLGDDVALNAGAWVQCHSQEDYAFKSDAITIGSGCTVGVSAMILYSARMGDGAVLAPDSFLMKGEEIPADERWGGNPAEALTHSTSGWQPRGHVAASWANAPVPENDAAYAVATD
ncbi:Pls/PosA family non-ribosomal peptide synthetase [Arthrobacter halodurans]